MRGGPGPVVRLAARIYAWATRLLPTDFRAEFGGELTECFHAIAVEARRRSVWAVVSVTVRSVVDLLTRAPREHLAAARAGALVPGTGLGGSWQDVRHAARRLRRRPSFALASVLTLALGLAAATSVFTLVHAVVLSPLPYPESERIVRVDHGAEGLGFDSGLGVTHGFYRYYEDRLRTAEVMAMYHGLDQTLTGVGDPVRVRAVRTTPSLGSVLGIRPVVGRWFREADAEEGAAPVVVLSHDLWRDRFGGDPGVVGQTALLEGTAREIVGVLPDDFAFPSTNVAVWTPFSVPATGIGGWNYQSIARLTPGATASSMEREIVSVFDVIRRDTDDPGRVTDYLDDAGVFPRIVSLKESVMGDVRATLWILMGTVGFVLLIALANVTNLFLVRAEETHRETAVRTALGAGGARLVRGFLAETVIIAGAGGAVGLSLAAVAVRVLRSWAPVNVPRLDEVAIDPIVAGTTAAAAIVTAVGLALIPILRGRGDLSSSLKEGHGRTTGGRSRVRGRNVLVAAQVALAMVLLIGSGLLFRTFQELRSTDLGFTERTALTFQIGLPGTRYPETADATRFHATLLERLESIPGVESASAVAACLPLTPHMCWGTVLEAEGYPRGEGAPPAVVGARRVLGDYFGDMEIPVRGRTFGPGDHSGAGRVAILSEEAARTYFRGDDPIGRRVTFEGDPHTIIGVAGNVRAKIETEEFQSLIYLPMHPAGASGPRSQRASYVLTMAGVPPTSVTSGVRQVLAEMDPAVPLADVRSLEGRIADATAPTAFVLTLIGVAAVMALLLGAVGVYAVVAYAVSRRTTEIGVRMAIGAAAGDVRGMVLRQGGVVVIAGVVIGLLAAAVLSRVMSGILYGVSPTDPLSYAAITFLMLAIGAGALYLPARRASRVDPLEALRAE